MTDKQTNVSNTVQVVWQLRWMWVTELG